MVTIGDVKTFPDVKPDKAQVMKIAEELMEVFSAWENIDCVPIKCDYCPYIKHYTCDVYESLLNECADVIQATSNLIAAFGVEDFTLYMQACEDRNRERGRL